MNSENLIAAINERCPGALMSSAQPLPTRLFLTVNKANMPEVADYLFNTAKARLVLSSATDKSPINGTYEVSYIYSMDQDRLMVSVKEIVDPADPARPLAD